MYKNDLALNNLQWLIRHKTQPNQTKANRRNHSCIFHEIKQQLDAAEEAECYL